MMQSSPHAIANFTVQSEVPRGLHVAIIMDGNGRWAALRNLPRVAGHRAGVDAVRRTVERAVDVDIQCLTLYAFSSDNWRRPAAEVQSIFWLLRAFLRLETERLRRRGVRVSVIGRRDRLSEPVLRAIEKTEGVTAGESRLHLQVAIDYSSRDAIARAALDAAVLRPMLADPSPDALRPIIAQALNGDGGEVDLLIRTGGEKRLSDFLLWESAYAELHFTDRMWPDFDAVDLDKALEDFRRRERRFGAVPATALTLSPAPQGSVR
jgi:undecaprenyl diphosphate synthase